MKLQDLNKEYKPGSELNPWMGGGSRRRPLIGRRTLRRWANQAEASKDVAGLGDLSQYRGRLVNVSGDGRVGTLCAPNFHERKLGAMAVVEVPGYSERGKPLAPARQILTRVGPSLIADAIGSCRQGVITLVV